MKSTALLTLALGSRSLCNFQHLRTVGISLLLEPPHLLTHDHMNSHVQKAAVDSEAVRVFGSESAQRVISRPYAA